MKLFPILLSAHACICSPNTTTVKLALAVATSYSMDIAVAIVVKLGDHFPTIAAACEANGRRQRARDQAFLYSSDSSSTI
jgi:hypothetical protein